MKIKSIWLSVLVVLIFIFVSSVFSQEKRNFFEFRCANFPDGGDEIPLSSKPLVKIYDDGTLIFGKPENKGFSYSEIFYSKLESQKLIELKEKLKKEPVLQKSQYIDLKKGYGIGLHGGICSVRFLDADEKVLLATSVYPTKGSVRRIIEIVEEFLPKKAAYFYPDEIKIVVEQISDTCEFISEFDKEKIVIDKWQFTNKFSLKSASLQDRFVGILLKEPQIIHFLFQEVYKDETLGFSWVFCENQVRYSINLKEVPDWYNPELNEQDWEAMQFKYNWEKANIKSK